MSKGKWRNYKSEENYKRITNCIFRVTPAEKKKLFELAEEQDLSLSEYILARALYVDNSNVIALKGEADKLYLELAKLGTNFNQATKSLNATAKALQESATFPRNKLERALEIITSEHEKRIELLRKISYLLIHAKTF